jgi:hypothetical protein
LRARRVIGVFAFLAVLAAVAVFALVRLVEHAGQNLPISLPAPEGCTFGVKQPAPRQSSQAAAPTVSQSTAPSAEPVSLDAEQAANAATIAAVGLRRGLPQKAVTVALATALQESKLENLSGGDRDSIGLFQQRPSQGWGTAEQVADPRYAANAFYSKLLKTKGWEKMRVTDAAQAVQRSAHPELYEQWAETADVLAKALTGETTSAVACLFHGQPVGAGPDAATNLTAGLKLDWGNGLSTAKAPDAQGVAVNAKNATGGWQYAHWLVAHAEPFAIKRVRFGGQEWTAKTGTWGNATDTSGDGSGQRVLAEVFTA